MTRSDKGATVERAAEAVRPVQPHGRAVPPGRRHFTTVVLSIEKGTGRSKQTERAGGMVGLHEVRPSARNDLPGWRLNRQAPLTKINGALETFGNGTKCLLG